MSQHRLPVCPDLSQVRRQAKELLACFRLGDPQAVSLFAEHSPARTPSAAKLTDAQFVLARAYQARDWPRLVQACQLSAAIWEDDLPAVRRLIQAHPYLLHERVLIRSDSHWGPPLTYAANLGRDRMITVLRDMGAQDLDTALVRAVLQSRVETAQMIHEMMGSPVPPSGALYDAAYTLSVSGTAFSLKAGVPVFDETRDPPTPVATVLETDSRNPAAKSAILQMYVDHGVVLPDTPPMALHRGRIDLLERYLEQYPDLLRRTFAFSEIYPPELGCHDELLATHGTPLAGGTLLHMAVDYDEVEIVKWLLDRGTPVDVRAAVDADGFGGHTALFGTVVSQPNFWINKRGEPYSAPLTQLLLDHGAAPNARASLRKQMHPGYGPDTMHEYRDVTPLSWGEQFHFRPLVSEAALALIKQHGGGL